jgi:nucleotide-binding universal stress UspA family protein
MEVAMASFGKILLPVDFSERSVVAARQAEVLVRHFHSDVTVLHVADPGEPEFGRFEPGGVKTHELETLLSRDFPGASISRIVRDGNPAREILDFAGSNHVDLIVMASHGYGPFESFAVGSIAAEVLRDADCPVWITAHAQQGLPPIFRNVLCAVDLGPGSEGVLNWASQFAAAFRARLVVLHAIRSFESEGQPDSPDEWLSHVERQELAKVKRKLGNEGQILFAGGDIPEAVCRQAKKLGADLLVIGRSPKADDAGTARTTSFTIIRKSPCPVVSIGRSSDGPIGA